MILYHYTTQASHGSITRTEQFAKSSPLTTMDSAYGEGGYFTDLDPDKCDPVILSCCWNNVYVTDRIEYHLKFDINDAIVKKCREHVFVIYNWTSQYIKYLGGGKTRDCSSKPCNTCEKGKKYYSK